MLLAVLCAVSFPYAPIPARFTLPRRAVVLMDAGEQVRL